MYVVVVIPNSLRRFSGAKKYVYYLDYSDEFIGIYKCYNLPHFRFQVCKTYCLSTMFSKIALKGQCKDYGMVTGNLNEQVRVTEFKTKHKDAGVTANPRP